MYERPESYQGSKHALPAPVPQAQVSLSKGLPCLPWRARPGSEVEGITAKDDPRITPVGKWLRQAKLNELPQMGTD